MTEVQFAKQFLTTLDSKPTRFQENHIFDPETFQIRVPYTLPKLSHPPHPLPPKTQQQPTAASGSTPTTASPSSSTIDVTLKSGRNPTFTLNLPSLPTSTPIATLRAQVQSLLSQSQPTTIPLDKIKVLQNKKPIPSSKSTVHDVLPESTSTASGNPASSIEFGIMVMGGAADPNPTVQTLNLNNDIELSPRDVGPESEKAAAQAVTTTSTTAAGSDRDPETVRATDPVSRSETSSAKDVLATPEFWDDLQGFLEQRLRNTEVAREVRGLFEKAVK